MKNGVHGDTGSEEPPDLLGGKGVRSVAELLRRSDLQIDVELGRSNVRESLGSRVGRYPITGFLGAGGMGEVLRALDADLGREVALKLIRRPIQRAGLARFVLEARVVSQLEHPNILPVHELALTDAGELYFTMPRIEGRNLKELLQAGDEDELGLPLIDLLQIFQKVADAVAYAHSAGVVHRDLKPSNVLVGRYGRVYLVDWGICRIRSRPDLDPDDGKLVGTPAYMAPERIDGTDDEGPLADVYALGAILYRILTRTSPFTGPASEVVSRIRAGKLEPPRDRAPQREIPFELDAIVRKAMASRPEDRYPSVEALQSDIRAFLGGRLVGAAEYTAVDLLRRWFREHRALLVVTVLSALALSVMGGIAISRLSREAEVAAANLAAFRGLAYSRQLEELEARADTLWPPYPTQLDALTRWRKRADDLVQKLERQDVVREVAGLAPEELRWLREKRVELSSQAQAFEETLLDVERRIAFARTVERRSIHDHREAWAQARSRVLADPRFGGWSPEPLIGLVPLGADPRSHLEEFADLQTGEIPTRDAQGLRIDEDSAVVYVLLPGGRVRMGARPVSTGAPQGSAHTDPYAEHSEPVHQVELAPFLMSKYELTQGQWQRVTGENPSFHQPSRSGDPADPSRPVEYISLEELREGLARFAARVPTEAQWEYAARGGSSTVWWTGDDPSSVPGAGNLAERQVELVPWQDGYDNRIAPVGQFAPNAFGLHDVIGNVYEWTRDGYHPYSFAMDVLPGTGERVMAERSAFVARGGSYFDSLRMARSAARMRTTESSRFRALGVRPVREFQSDSGLAPVGEDASESSTAVPASGASSGDLSSGVGE